MEGRTSASSRISKLLRKECIAVPSSFMMAFSRETMAVRRTISWRNEPVCIISESELRSDDSLRGCVHRFVERWELTGMLSRDVLSSEIRIKVCVSGRGGTMVVLCTYRVDELQYVSHSFEDEE